MAFHDQSIAQILVALQAKEIGLSTEQAEKRLAKHGKNVLPKNGEKATRLKIFLHQWKSPLVIILIIAGTVSGALGEILDMGIIFITAAVNSFIGFLQEDKANRALKTLRDMVQYRAVVLRDGHKQVIASEKLVPGDILFLDAGDTVQADGRFLRGSLLELNEASLTGESLPVRKLDTIVSSDSSLGDRVNMVYRGTQVVNGRGEVIITATGKDTELGQIALMVEDVKEDKTPLQKELAIVSRNIGIIVIAICFFILAGGFFFATEQYHWLELFTTAVAVAVAAIPEGLVIALTVILAIGMGQMARRRALVRKLLAAETLGSVSVICADKTGTITEGRMRVQEIITAGSRAVASDFSSRLLSDPARADALFALRISVLCNDGILQNPEAEEQGWKFLGDTTDVAILQAGIKSGIQKSEFEKVQPRISDIPFTSEAKYIATLHKIDHETNIFVKGAPDVVLQKCSAFEEAGRPECISPEKRSWFEKEQLRLSGQGLRVIAAAYKKSPAEKSNLLAEDIHDLVFVGLLVLSDPIRSDVAETISKARRAGIHVVMITGDHRKTAQYIARALGLPTDDAHTFDGKDLDCMTDFDLQKHIKNASIFARVEPRHKIRIVRAFQANGDVVAMTGDGVNDAPAIKGADIGIALGSGTDVAKETSDMVLLDDSFSTIVAAVEEGRRIYQNIKKVLLYLLAGSFIEVILISWSMLAGLPLPLLPAQILWMNIIVESFTAMALAFDRGEGENMAEAPRKRSVSLFDRETLTIIIAVTIVTNVLRIAIFWYFYSTTADLALSRTVAFVGLGIDALLFIFAVRSMRFHFWQMNPFDNRYLVVAVSVGWLLLLAGVYFIPVQTLLRTVPLGLREWGVLIGLGLVSLFLIEGVKSVFMAKRHINI